MTRLKRILELVGFELADIRRSRWLTFTLLVYGVLVGVFVLVGLRESSVLGFTGLGRVLINFSHALVFLLPLLALTATAQVFPKAREDGTLELLMSQPISRSDYFLAVAASRLIALVGPLLVMSAAIALLAGLALGQPIPWVHLGNMLAASTTLLVAFVGLGLLISAAGNSQAKTLIFALIAWAAGVALVDFGLIAMMLQWRLNPESVFALATVNPVQCARFVLLASAEPELSILGPVGFFMVNRLGHTWLGLIGVGWPALFGTATLTAGWWKFRRSDLF
jgi:ABC-2 type transport system permease protein